MLYNFFIKKKIIVKGDIVIKTLIAILLPVSFICPTVIFLVIILDGVLNPFNTMSHLEMLGRDYDSIGVPQKDMVINLSGYVAKMLSAYIFLNIKSDIAICIMALMLVVSTILEFMVYKTSDRSKDLT